MRFLRLSAFEGLQPASWWFSPSVEEYMAWPASYYCGGTTNEVEGLLFGKSMHGEDIIHKDPQQLSGFLRQFCTQTLPWYYLNRLQRLEYRATDTFKKVLFSGQVETQVAGSDYTMMEKGRLILRNGDVFVPVPWMEEPAIIAYSEKGYRDKEWILPDSWDAPHVDIYQITLQGKLLQRQSVPVGNKKIKFNLLADEAVLIVPEGK